MGQGAGVLLIFPPAGIANFCGRDLLFYRACFYVEDKTKKNYRFNKTEKELLCAPYCTFMESLIFFSFLHQKIS